MEQRRQACKCRSVGDARLDRVETGNLQAANQNGVGRHGVMVTDTDLAMEHNRRAEDLATSHNSQSEGLRVADMVDAYQRAIEAGGFIDKTAADALGISASQLSRQLRSEPNYHLSCQRLTLLPRASQVAFVQLLAQRLGLDVVTPDLDALAMGELLQAMGRIIPRYRMAVARLTPAGVDGRKRA